MRIVIAPDKYKGTLSSAEAADALREGVLQVCFEHSKTDISQAK